MATRRQSVWVCACARLSGRLAMVCAATLLAACGSLPTATAPERTPAAVRAQLVRLLPDKLADKAGWATDIQTALHALDITGDDDNLCAVLAITAQESGFDANPAVPNLGKIAWAEIERRADSIGVPMFAVRAALSIGSRGGLSFGERIDAATTERELSEIFDDIIVIVPLGSRLFAHWNPVRTGGPMQVSIAFAETHANQHTYPYPIAGSVRSEVFTRRGGMYFGIAHLLGYPAGYDKAIYRFADYNAGHYASRNAAFQNAVKVSTGIALALDGDLIAFDAEPDKPGSTERAVRKLMAQSANNMFDDNAIRRALELGNSAEFSDTALYRAVFAIADKAVGRAANQAVPRALVPDIRLNSPKITRKLTTAWFAQRVETRYQQCLQRAANTP